jgi:protein TonB
MAGLLLWRVDPVYPAEARAAQIRGTVVLRATIGEDGKVAHLDVVAGPEPLRGPALDAVAQWVYKPYLLHRQPHAVETTIFVNFDGK